MKKIGLLALYALLITSALRATSKPPIENPLNLIVPIAAVLAFLLIFILRQRQQDR